MSDIKMSDMFKTEMLSDDATVYNLKDSEWLGLPSKCNDWCFGVQNVSAKDEERRKAAKYIAHAINSHDDLVKRVAELKKALIEVSEQTIDLFAYTIDEVNYYTGLISDCLVNDEVGTIRTMVKVALKESE